MESPRPRATPAHKGVVPMYQQLLRDFIVQLRDGCGHSDCRTPTCFSCRSSRMSPGSRHARKYTSATAKAIAVELISSENPSQYVCPNLSRSPRSASNARRQENTDPKSLVQQLFNTRAFDGFLQASDRSDITETQLLENLSRALEWHLVQDLYNPDSPEARPDPDFTEALAMQAVQQLTASIPCAQRDTWDIVWPALSKGRAYGKQRFCKADSVASPWLQILDAFESQPALQLATRLLKVVALGSAAEAALLRGHVDEPEDPAVVSTLRRAILSWLVEESSSVGQPTLGSSIRHETSRDQAPFETTAIIWLEWLRKCFLKSWDGSYRLSRRSVAGVALVLMEDLWNNRGRLGPNLYDRLFLNPVVFHNFSVDKVAVDWLDYHDDLDTRHILSFHFLFPTRAVTSMFRMVNYIRMRRAYCAAGAVHKMRLKALPRASLRDTAYLDQRMKIAQEPYLVLKINRHSVLSDAFDQIWHRLKGELLKPLRIRMGIDEGEIGHDLGGVQIEFFKLVCSEALDPAYGLFSTDPETHLAWFQPASLVPLYKYELFGVLFALAVYNGVTLPVSFPLYFYRKLLDERDDYDTLTWESSCALGGVLSDLREGWPALFNALQALCMYKGSLEEDLAQDYTFSFLANGLNVEVKMTRPWRTRTDTDVGKMTIINAFPDKHHSERTHAHKPQPEPESKSEPVSQVDCTSLPSFGTQSASLDALDIEALAWPGWQLDHADPAESVQPVTRANSQQYVLDYIRWLLDYSIQPQFLSFARGFAAVLDRKALSLLTPSAFRALVEGHEHLNVVLLQRAATYRGYDADSQVVQWFWEVVNSYPEEKQKQLLEFVTATSRVPVNGEESLTFIIEQMPGDTDSLPGSSTCFSTLRLPEYESKDVLKQKLDIALEHSLGFGQA